MNNIDSILSQIRTQQEAQELLTQLDSFGATLYSIKQSSLQDHFSHLPKGIADSIYDLFNDSISKNDGAKAHEIASQLQDKIRSSKTIQITVAFEPDDTAITIFSTWAKNNIGSDVLLDIQINRALVGGAIIVADGQYKDYSVRKKLSQVFQIQRDHILSNFNNL